MASSPHEPMSGDSAGCASLVCPDCGSVEQEGHRAGCTREHLDESAWEFRT